ncbi:MAG: hypothetical protein JNK72_01925 [Myxococcales bacterium]|nr:hypothetical protein [Myxococcales bacterium]
MTTRLQISRLPNLARQREAHRYLCGVAEKIQHRAGFSFCADQHLFRLRLAGERGGVATYGVAVYGHRGAALEALLGDTAFEAPSAALRNDTQRRMVLRDAAHGWRVLDLAKPGWVQVPPSLGEVHSWRGSTVDVIVRKTLASGETEWSRFDTTTGRVRGLPCGLGAGELRSHEDGVHMLFFGAEGLKLIDLYDGCITDHYHCGPAEMSAFDAQLNGVVFTNWRPEALSRRSVEFDDALRVGLEARSP